MPAPDDRCDVCEREGKAAKRCQFGARSGPCSCWRGVPCGKGLDESITREIILP